MNQPTIQRQMSGPQTSQPSQQQKFYVTKTSSPSTSSPNIVKIQQSQKIFIQASSKPVYVTTQNASSNNQQQQNPEIDDLSHLA